MHRFSGEACLETNEGGHRVGNRTDHHETLSDLGFFFDNSDLPIINNYPGAWAVTNPAHIADNYWVITTDGRGHNVLGNKSPQQILDWGKFQGWDCAYVAPYGQHIEGQMDGIHLHDWIVEGRRKMKHEHH